MSMSSLILIIVIAICIEDLELKRESLDIKTKEIKKEIFFFINYSAGFSLDEVPNMAKGKGKKLSIVINFLLRRRR